MWQDFLDWSQQFEPSRLLAVIWLSGAGLLLVAGWLWWSYASLNPQDVFWGTVNNNLVTTAVTKHLSSDVNGSKLDQTQRISLGAQNIVTSDSLLTQAQGKQVTTVKTQAIATPTVNYDRYLDITSSQTTKNGQPLDFGSLLGQWGKQSAGSSGNGAFAQAIFDILPFSYLNAGQRQTVIHAMQQNNLYSINYRQLKKRQQNGRLIYDYPIAISQDNYLNMLKQVDAAMGLNQLSKLDVSQAQGGAPVQLTVSIDAHARQLVAISYPGSNQTEEFSSYGLSRQVVLPSKTVDQTVLQAKLGQLLSQQ